MRHFCLFTLLVCLVTHLYSQPEPHRIELAQRRGGLITPIPDAQHATYSRTNNRWFFRQDSSEQWQRAGAYGRRLKPFFAGDPSAQKAFHRYRASRATGTACGIFALGGFLLAGGGVFFNSISSAIGGDGEGFNAPIIAGLGAGLAFTVGSGVAKRNANRHLLHAANIYNQDLSALPQPSRGSLGLRPSFGPNWTGLAVAWDF